MSESVTKLRLVIYLVWIALFLKTVPLIRQSMSEMPNITTRHKSALTVAQDKPSPLAKLKRSLGISALLYCVTMESVGATDGADDANYDVMFFMLNFETYVSF